MDDWFAVLNPVSGGGRGLRDRQRIEALLRQEGVSCTTAVSEYAGHALELARSAITKLEVGYAKQPETGTDFSK